MRTMLPGTLALASLLLFTGCNITPPSRVHLGTPGHRSGVPFNTVLWHGVGPQMAVLASAVNDNHPATPMVLLNLPPESSYTPRWIYIEPATEPGLNPPRRIIMLVDRALLPADARPDVAWRTDLDRRAPLRFEGVAAVTIFGKGFERRVHLDGVVLRHVADPAATLTVTGDLFANPADAQTFLTAMARMHAAAPWPAPAATTGAMARGE